jgi:citrate lyase subunit beta / citryl-CoA lyase
VPFWLFVDGANEGALFGGAPQCGAEVLVQELEDFTPPEGRGKARAMAPRRVPARA